LPGELALPGKLALLPGELALSCNVATDRLVNYDVRGLSTTEPCSKAWIWGRIKPKDAGMPSPQLLRVL
jgi:hypothetical protein